LENSPESWVSKPPEETPRGKPPEEISESPPEETTVPSQADLEKRKQLTEPVTEPDEKQFVLLFSRSA